MRFLRWLLKGRDFESNYWPTRSREDDDRWQAQRNAQASSQATGTAR